MFSNIGKKIKTLAKVMCIIGIVFWVIVGFVVMCIGFEQDVQLLVLLGFIYAVIGALFSWIGSFFMCGFGELVESSTETSKYTKAIYEEIKTSSYKSGSFVTDTPSNAGYDYDTSYTSNNYSSNNNAEWYCANCGTENAPASAFCKNCGTKK